LQKLFNLFRSSGRFAWPVFYFIVIFTLVSIMRYLRHPLPLLAFALVLQFVDIRPLTDEKHLAGFDPAYKAGLQNEFWQGVIQTNEHLMVLAPRYNRDLDYEPLTVLASVNGMTLNQGYFARSDITKSAAYVEQVRQDLLAGQPDAHTLYFFPETMPIDLEPEDLQGKMVFCEVDGYTIALAQDNPLLTCGMDLSPYCALP